MDIYSNTFYSVFIKRKIQDDNIEFGEGCHFFFPIFICKSFFLNLLNSHENQKNVSISRQNYSISSNLPKLLLQNSIVSKKYSIHTKNTQFLQQINQSLLINNHFLP